MVTRPSSVVMVISWPHPLLAVAGRCGAGAPGSALSTMSAQRPLRLDPLSGDSAAARRVSRTSASAKTVARRVCMALLRRRGRDIGIRRPHRNERVAFDALPEVGDQLVGGGDDAGIEVLDVGLLLGIAPQV